jgi:hypothetical protein
MSVKWKKATFASQQMASLFDHRIGAGDKPWRDSEAECFCGGGIQHESRGPYVCNIESAKVDFAGVRL